MKMRFIFLLALAGLVSAGDDDSGRRNRDRNAPKNWGNRDSPDSMDTNYCCMTHHAVKVTTKLEEYLKSDATNPWLLAAKAKYASFSCDYRDGWSYCCPDGGKPQVVGKALCACQKRDDSDDNIRTLPGRGDSDDRFDWDDSVDVVRQDCDSVDDWLSDLIKARFNHSEDSDWQPENGRCDEKAKDACGCCPNFGWDSDEYGCEYKEDTDRNDKRFCKAFDWHDSSVDETGMVDDSQVDECGCLPAWGWDSSEDACEPDEYTEQLDKIACKEFFDDSEWDSWVPPVHTIRPVWGIKDDSDDSRFKNPFGPIRFGGNSDDGPTIVRPGRRRLLALNDSNDRLIINGPRDECGCIRGKQGWDNGRCRNNAGPRDSNDSRDNNKVRPVYVTDYQDVRFCRGMRNRINLGGKRDACGCNAYWGWKNGTCEPGEITSKKDKKRCRDDSKDSKGDN